MANAMKISQQPSFGMDSKVSAACLYKIYESMYCLLFLLFHSINWPGFETTG